MNNRTGCEDTMPIRVNQPRCLLSDAQISKFESNNPGFTIDQDGDVYSDDGDYIGNYTDKDCNVYNVDESFAFESEKWADTGDIINEPLSKVGKRQINDFRRDQKIEVKVFIEPSSDAGTVTGAGVKQWRGILNKPDNFRLVAIAEDGYKFKSWYRKRTPNSPWEKVRADGIISEHSELEVRVPSASGDSEVWVKAVFEKDEEDIWEEVWEEIEREAEEVEIEDSITVMRTIKSTFEVKLINKETDEEIEKGKRMLTFNHQLVEKK